MDKSEIRKARKRLNIKDFRQKRHTAGFHRLEVYVHDDYRQMVKDFVTELNKEIPHEI